MNIKCPLDCYLGYGHCSSQIIKALHNKGIPLSLHPIGQPRLTTNDGALFTDLINKRYDTFDVNQLSLTIFHEFAFFEALQSKKEVVGFPFFELDEMDLIRRQSLSCLDRLFVASKWAQDIVSSYYKGPIHVIPLGVDNTIFYPNKIENNSPYKFFTIGKIEKRKCTHLLPRIFSAAFNLSDNVELHVMCDSPLPQIKQQMPYYRDLFTKAPLGAKTFIHELKATDEDLANFIRSMDCGIFMTRAEGWGLPILQSLACGKPIIVTDYSAQTEFCNATNANLVHITEKEIADDGIWFHGGGAWASIGEPQLQQCVTYMKELYQKNIRTNAEGVLTGQKFSWENCADKIIGALGRP